MTAITVTEKFKTVAEFNVTIKCNNINDVRGLTELQEFYKELAILVDSAFMQCVDKHASNIDYEANIKGDIYTIIHRCLNAGLDNYQKEFAHLIKRDLGDSLSKEVYDKLKSKIKYLFDKKWKLIIGG